MGRPTKFKEKFIEQAHVACVDLGATIPKLAKLFGTTERTLLRWKKDIPEFGAAVDSGRDLYDSNLIERSLRDRAAGYNFIETRIKEIKIKTKDKAGKVLTLPAQQVTTTERHIPPEVGAIEMWLYNRRPDRWRSRKFVQVDKTDRRELTLRLRLEELKQLEVYELEGLLEYLVKSGFDDHGAGNRVSQAGVGGKGTGVLC